MQSYYYWSSMSYASGPSYARYVLLHGGSVGRNAKAFPYYVWPDRGGQ
ncbi:MAG: hypothetical protein ABFS37_16515 [Acidobacteriota bacterium]